MRRLAICHESRDRLGVEEAGQRQMEEAGVDIDGD
jgi:hypothetical protein